MPNIEQRGKTSWRLTVENGFGPNGKRVQERKTVMVSDPDLLKSKRKLEAYLNMELLKFQQEVESGDHIKPEKTTFEEFVKVWKKNYADQSLGDYTRKNYIEIINTHLIPAFGHYKMDQLKTIHIVKFMTHLRSPEARRDGRSKPLATNTILNIFKALKSILDAAKQWRIIAKNPMDGVDRPVPDKKEKKALKAKKKSYTADEAERAILALYSEPKRWMLYYIGVLLGGYRRGEMLGVEWPAVDFKADGIYVEKQISFDEEGRSVEAELKTEESEGFIPMPRWYMNELQEYKKQSFKERLEMDPRKWKGGDKQYVFHNGTGDKYYPNTPSLTWRRFLKRHNLPSIRLHDLRHTTAMLLRDDGADMKSIQERLRHSKLSTTADIYTHESKKISRETADRLEKLNPQNKVRSQLVPKT
jgi:integrase